VPEIAYGFTGGGHYGSETEVRTKEQADHDLRYLLAVALLDGNVMPAQFTLLRRPPARPKLVAWSVAR
jgi:2-methylcitrate dehydratase